MIDIVSDVGLILSKKKKNCGRGHSLVVICGVGGTHSTHAHESLMMLKRQKVTPGRSFTHKLHHVEEEVKNNDRGKIFSEKKNKNHFFWRRLQVP